jgi:oligopeptide/dipeptide ABC transporter ATP-binding protein
MKQLQEERGTAILFITHDLGVVAEVADDLIIMYAGKVVERGSVQRIFEEPAHPYTRALISSIPSLDTERKSRLVTVEGAVPDLRELPHGCRFHPRCPHAAALCRELSPELSEIEPGHAAACHLAAGALDS